MCVYCERRENAKFGWDQPSLYDEHWQHPVVPDRITTNLNLDGESDWEAVIHDYQTCTPKLVLTSQNMGRALFGDGAATINIPIKYCLVCGRKLGNNAQDANNGDINGRS